ncbi:MAG TPA: ComEC/Rec2 family competence protein [Aliidongia sp.]|uniref:ComEC/Rec2 family competence protein n=1 Tax=Aliidongia sp. TaxID=1914230 RepID=UPI002DDCA125|nr:ComEC/Rec2 family competence protein [Aliidongia sp.]HEV2678509.1 ComEC/Rec2 family competence protein [Aliidongia sp.]
MVDEAAGKGASGFAWRPPSRIDVQGVAHGLLLRLVAERERWVLWLPVAFALGIGGYFALRSEPWGGLGITMALPLAALSLWARRSLHPVAPTALLIALPLCLVAGGFAVAQFETWRVAAPALERRIGPAALDGRVIEVETLNEGIRVTLGAVRLDRLAPDRTPARVRVRLKAGSAVPEVGDHLSVSAILMPPPAPALPGGFDFQRQAFFQRLGAVGFAVGSSQIVPAARSSISTALRSVRSAMTARIHAALPGPEGAIAAAIITGERGAIPAGINQDFRDSGLAHLLVIAGLHMTLATGAAFFAIRAILALVPRIALVRPIKKWAALGALLIALLYLAISGAAVPTQRAFVMCVLALLAILIDRQPVSMRSLAWAAFLVMALDPVAIVGVSFQMSFAAVLGLIAFYEAWGGKLGGLRQDAGPIGHGLLHLLGIALTTIVATLGTAAFAIYHFNRFALFSVPANLIAVPLAGVWVMPWALVSCLLMPLGLESVGLVPMGWGIAVIERVAHWTAGLPSATLDLPTMPDWGLLLIVVGGLWLALWRAPWRRWGVMPVLIGVASLTAAHAPDLILAADGALVAVRSNDAYLLSSERTDRLAAETWLRTAGGIPSGPLPAAGEAAEHGAIRCDAAGCLILRNDRRIALVRDISVLDEECRTSDLVLSLVRAPRRCGGRTRLIDLSDLRHNGATALWFGDPLRIESANAQRGDRPWVPNFPAARPVSSAASGPRDDPAP